MTRPKWLDVSGKAPHEIAQQAAALPFAARLTSAEIAAWAGAVAGRDARTVWADGSFTRWNPAD